MINLIEQIRDYNPYNDQERHDQQLMLHQMNKHKDIFNRDNKTAHLTASAWVVNRERSKVLMIYHNIYDSWSWLGGHADGERDLLSVAVREVLEESGISQVKSVSDDIFSLEIMTVDGHEKNGKYVSSHLHLNLTYLLEADEDETLTIKPDENSGVAWFELDEAIQISTEPWLRKRIYKKLNEKLINFRF